MLKFLVKRVKTQKEAKWGRRLSPFGLLASLCIGAGLGTYVAGHPELSPWITLTLFSFCIVVSVIFAQIFYELEGWFEQRQRDLSAQKMFSGLSNATDADSEKYKDFILYLRPFASTGQIESEKTNVVAFRHNIHGGPQFVATTDRVEFEEDIEKALRPLGQLIALGKPLEHIGAGRIRVDDESWQEAISLLIKHAKFIILLPSPRPGTSWEVEHLLRSGAVRKTIVVDPPNDRGVANSDYDPVWEWSGVRETFLDYGYVLPVDNPDGQLLVFAEGTQPQRRAKIGWASENKIRSFAKALIKDLDQKKQNVS